MKLLLLQNQNARNVYKLKKEFFPYKVEIPIPENPYTGAGESQVMENYYFSDALIEIAKFHEDYEAIVISHWLFPDSTGMQPPDDRFSSFFSAVQLASFIRLAENEYIRNSPIVIISGYPESEILRDSFHRPELLFASYGTRLIPEAELSWDLPEKVADDPLDSAATELSVRTLFKLPTREDIQKNYDELIRKRLLITDNSTDSHSVANHFGAFRIASLLGKEELIRWPRNLYFNYLISRSVEPNRKKLLEIPASYSKLKVLIIDDQVHNGWKEVLDLIFPLRVKAESAWNSKIEQEIRQGLYDLVLLDYRLGETGPEGKNGLDRLRQIKGSFKRNEAGEIEKDENGNSIEEYPGLNPVMPVIMFTASNKAWNMDALYEAGADGYYIKEHPDTASDADFSVNNFNNFIKTIDRCRKKGKLLKPYWQALTDIGALFSEEQGPVKDKTLSDSSKSDFKGRISERITMFIGLLKKAYEQTAFDEKAFFYSDYELAFLTLWSVLNELQEAYFNKKIGYEFPEGSGQIYSFHEDNLNSPFVAEWTLKGAEFPLLIKSIKNDLFEMETDFNGFYKVNSYSCYYLFKNKINTGDLQINQKIELQLYFQILFILQNSSDISSSFKSFHLSETDSQIKDKKFLNRIVKEKFDRVLVNLSKKMVDLNYFRNKLYLTHGEEANSPVFAKTYLDQRRSLRIKGEPIDFHLEIKKLFEIVYFLCTAKEWSPESSQAETWH